MQVSDLPAKIPEPFAKSGGRNAIPDATASPAASWALGFPPATRTPIGAGGTPPAGLDMNGVLYSTSAWAQWVSAGGPIAWDATFSTTIGGYPKGALVSGTTLGSFYVNGTENNTTNPNTSGAGWATLASYILASAALTGTPTAPTAPAGNNSTRVATTAYADTSAANAGAAAVTTANNFTSAALAAYLPLAGGAITGVVTAPTQAVNNNSTRLSTTAYADRSATNAGAAAVTSANGYTDTTVQAYAPLIGATFTGNVRGLTAASGNNSTLFATTAYVQGELSSYFPRSGGTLTGSSTIQVASGTAGFTLDSPAGNAKQFTIRSAGSARWNDIISGAESGGNSGADRALNAFADNGALLGSVYSITRSTRVLDFTNSPTAPTPAALSNNTLVATARYVDRAVGAPFIAPQRLASATGVIIGGSYSDLLVANNFTAPCDGYVEAAAGLNVGAVGAANIRLIVRINGNIVAGDNEPLSQSQRAFFSVTAGTVCSGSLAVTTTTNPGSIPCTYWFAFLWHPTP